MKVNNNSKADQIITDEDVLFGKRKRLAFLDLLIIASESGKLLNDDELQEEVNTFMFEVRNTNNFYKIHFHLSIDIGILKPSLTYTIGWQLTYDYKVTIHSAF